ncbi:phosphatidate cytidylyltransferase [Chloroflexota bacterium]
MLKKRVISALWGIPLLAAAVWFEQPVPWFTVLIVIWGLLAVFEFYRMVAASSVSPLTYFGLVLTLLFILSPHYNYDFFIPLLPLLLTSLVVLPLIWLLLRAHKENAVSAWVWTVAGILYVGWLLSYLVALRLQDDGRNWVFLALFVTFASDTSAFFTGRALGKNKLAPNISPGKTWEGAIGGIVGAIIFSLFFVLPTPFALPINWWQAVLLGLLVSIFGQFGDLVESLFKRNMGVKDSGNLLSGHGGFLDRVDSVVFAGVLVYYYAVWMIL